MLRGGLVPSFSRGLAVLAGPLALAACSQIAAPQSAEAEKTAIRRVIANMQDAWNRGDFRGYMAGFKNPDVVFVSRGEFQRDWQGTLDHYVRDYGGSPERRGEVQFEIVRIEMLSPDAAQLISRYRLTSSEKPRTESTPGSCARSMGAG